MSCAEQTRVKLKGFAVITLVLLLAGIAAGLLVSWPAPLFEGLRE